MGLFDEITFESELPGLGKTGEVFQTKDTPAQSCDCYKVDGEGLLWHEPHGWGYDDQKRKKQPWRPCGMTGEVVFYTDIEGDWWEFSAYFLDGKLNSIHKVDSDR